jgi:hypothetical protein
VSHVVRRLLRRPSFGTLAALIGAALVVVLATPLVGSARPKESHRATAAPRATAAAVHGRGGIAVGGRAPRKFAAAAVGAQLRVIGHGQRALFVYSGRHARALAKTGRSAGLPTAPAPKEPVAAVAPAILGRGALHEPLHVDVGRWTSAEPVAFTFQWQRCAQPVGDCVAIRGADAPDFTPEAFNARPGDLLRVVVSAWTASGGTTVVSPPTRPVEGTRPEAVRPAAIHGDPRDGGRVAATAGEWASLEPFTLEFQWQRCAADGASCADIAGATAPDYVAGPLDVGSRLRAVVRAADGTGAASEPSALSDVVAAEKPRAADPPRLVGRGAVGASVLALAQYWYGTPPFTRDFQWLRCDASGKVCLPIAGATSQRYTVTAADSGGAVAVEVTAHNAAGPGSTISEPLAIEPPEASNAPPPGTTTDVPDTPKRSLSSARRALTTCVQNPTIVSPPGQSPTGSIHVGGTITITTPGSWSPPAGTCPDWDYDYAWFRDGGLLSHAKGTPPGNTTYGTGGADLGHSIEAQIT